MQVAYFTMLLFALIPSPISLILCPSRRKLWISQLSSFMENSIAYEPLSQHCSSQEFYRDYFIHFCSCAESNEILIWKMYMHSFYRWVVSMNIISKHSPTSILFTNISTIKIFFDLICSPWPLLTLCR